VSPQFNSVISPCTRLDALFVTCYIYTEDSSKQRQGRMTSGRTASVNGYSASSGRSTPASSKHQSQQHQQQPRLFNKRSGAAAAAARPRKAELTINARPFSAPQSPYEEKLVNTLPQPGQGQGHLRKNKANSVQ